MRLFWSASEKNARAEAMMIVKFTNCESQCEPADYDGRRRKELLLSPKIAPESRGPECGFVK